MTFKKEIEAIFILKEHLINNCFSFSEKSRYIEYCADYIEKNKEYIIKLLNISESPELVNLINKKQLTVNKAIKIIKTYKKVSIMVAGDKE